MHVEFLVEEPSAEAALQNLFPTIVGPGHTFRIHVFQGAPDLMKQLPGRLRGYRSWLPEDWYIVVLRDVDREDCHDLKATLDNLTMQAGLVTKSAAEAARFQVMNRLAVEELEAWFIGDVEALCAAYPRISADLDKQSRYRVPDQIQGGTKEALHRLLQRKGYHPGGVPQIATAREISRHMDPDRNRSRSFRAFRDGLRALARQARPEQ